MFFVYVYFTDGLQTWAECYLESFRHYNGSDIKIVAEARDVSDGNAARLHELYPNLELRNRALDLDALARLAGEPMDRLLRWKHEVEHEVTTDENFRWKLLISVEERYRSLYPIMEEFVGRGFTHMLHTDIDVYFRSALGRMDELIAENDAALYFRKHGIWGGMLGVSATPGGMAFLKEWRDRIDELPFCDKPRGYGQKSLAMAYEARKDRLRCADLATDPRSLTMSKTDNADPDSTPDADIWVGNSNSGRNRKDVSVRTFLDELRRKQSADLSKAQ